MKTISTITYVVMLLIANLLTACEGEKELVIIEGNLPIKTETLYMVGDAAPAGWNIDAPTPLTATEVDPLVFIYEGHLNTGELKFPLTTGNWGGAFIMPAENGVVINRNGIGTGNFSLMSNGQPDNKWRVEEAGTYRLTLDLRQWTIDATFIGE